VCKNCFSVPCLDGKVIVSTDQLTNINSKVAVPNCSVDNWGTEFRAQRGQITGVASEDTVRVSWINGTESAYNVHDSDNPEADSVLCFNCLLP